MALARVHTWAAGEVLLASDLNAEYNNLLNNAADLVSPFTKAISMGGFALNFDAANTIALTAATNGVSLTGGAFNTAQGADIASAATLNLDTATGNMPDVTGTTTITAVTLSQGRWRLCRFTGALTITNGASLVVEGGADFLTVAGQYVFFVGYASSVVRCIPFTTPAATQTLTNKTITGSTNTIGGAQAQNVPVTAIGYVFDGGGSALTTGVKGDLLIPFACTINSATLEADQSGSIVIDIWKKAYALDSPPTVANTITASALPTLATHQSAQDTTLTGWTTAIAANDMLRFNINSITTCTRVTLTLKVTKT